MKGSSIILTAIVLSALCFGGCGGQKEEPAGNAGIQEKQEAAESENQSEENSGEINAAEEKLTEENKAEESKDEAPEDISIRFEESKEEYKAEDGTVLLTVEYVLPIVQIIQYPEAAEAINHYIKQAEYSPAEAVSVAEEDYRQRGADNWYGYSLGNAFTVHRADEEVISFTADEYSYMGGAHPNAVRSGYNFNSRTGDLLTLDDIIVDKEAAAEAVNAYILEYIAKELEDKENQGMYFEDYEINVGQLLNDNTWYLAEDGFHIIGNEYIISPHAAGILDFVIPYEQADFLKSEYRL